MSPDSAAATAFAVPAGVETNCPRCGFANVVATPMAGPDAPFYCPSCDSGFS